MNDWLRAWFACNASYRAAVFIWSVKREIELDRAPLEVIDDAMVNILHKTETERLRIAPRLYQSARMIIRGAIMTDHPDWALEEINCEIARRIGHGAIR